MPIFKNNYIGKINNPDVFGGASLDLYNLNISPEIPVQT
jgi:hypothetical protein